MSDQLHTVDDLSREKIHRYLLNERIGPEQIEIFFAAENTLLCWRTNFVYSLFSCRRCPITAYYSNSSV